MSLTQRQKNRLIYAGLMFLCLVGFWWFENFYTEDPYPSPAGSTPAPAFREAWLPAGANGERIRHDHYLLEYAESYEQAAWVAYVLDPAHLTDDDRDRPYFVEDPEVSTYSADWRNYRGSGYDRGHLCPAGDRRYSLAAYNQTFYTSNISPQNREFNAGAWNELEMQVRRWCRRYGRLYILTAGVLEPGLSRIGEEGGAVPRSFYKIVAREGENGPEVVAFLMPNQPLEGPLWEFSVSVDRIEAVTGLDFFHGLPAELQEKFESHSGAESWEFR